MHRFFLAPNDWELRELRDGEAHHARDVLRLQPNDRLIVFDGRGREATAEIAALDRGLVRIRVLQQSVTPSLGARISLAQAIPKGKNMDLIVQKAVEIGAAEFFPLRSARTVVQLDPETAAQKQAKWQTVALEAAKQCGQNWIPQIHRPQSPNDFFSGDSGTGYDLRLIGSLQPGALHLKKILAEYAQAHSGTRPREVLILVGPEGDFTPAEIALARSHGCQPLTLGPIILRVETAAIYCLSILSYELLGEG
jgi:16S rRNA (uracil1498-N3)-methyltransferase